MGEGSIFPLQLIILKAALWPARLRKNKSINSREGGLRKIAVFISRFYFHLKFSKWVLSKVILNILGIFGGRPDQALRYLNDLDIYFLKLW